MSSYEVSTDKLAVDNRVSFIKLTKAVVTFNPLAFFAVAIFYILFFLAPLSTSVVIKEIFNTVEGKGDYSFSVWVLILFIPLLYMIKALFDVFATLSEFIFELGTEALLRTNMLSKVLMKPGGDSLPGSSGEAISRFRGDVSEIGWFVNFLAYNTGFFVFGVLATALLLSINVKITLITYIPVILSIFIVILLRKRVMMYRTVSRKAAGRVTGSIAEIFNSIQAIKVANAEKNINKYFADINENRRVAVVKDRTFNRILRSINESTSAYASALLLIFIAALMKDGSFTLGDYVLYTSLFGWIQRLSIAIGELIAWNARQKVSYSRIYKILESTTHKFSYEDIVEHQETYLRRAYPDIKTFERISQPLISIRVENLSYHYRDSSNGISDVSFVLDKKFNVITGEVGSGKSTLIKTLLGLLPHQTGAIYWNEVLVTDPAEFFVPPRSTYTAQVPKLFSDTIQENILLGLPESDKAITDALSLAILNDDMQNFDDGLATIIGPKGIKLSGGQKQRLATARMLLRVAELIVVDDLSSALDVVTEKQLWEGIFNKVDAKFLIVSHRKSVLKRADQILIMSNGRLKAVGKLEDLLDTNEELQAIFAE